MLNYDLVCFAHLRWDFVYQRPQHLLSRAAQERRIFYVEEPIFDCDTPTLELREDVSGVVVAVPHLPWGPTREEHEGMMVGLIAQLFERCQIHNYVVWMYSPMFTPYLENLRPKALVFDVMDELSAFKFAPPILLEREQQLLDLADVVFTGGVSLWEAKKDRHSNVHAFPSSVDVGHFMQARKAQPEPQDLAGIPHPRVGFYGVVDERFDLELLREVASTMAGVQFVVVGPVVKIDPADLPRADNIHYLGQKSYAELPQYLAHWDVAMMPFAMNDSTRYISPTKTPEYLAAGKPTVSTPIRDVVRPYGEMDLVWIASDAGQFAAGVREALSGDYSERGARADRFVGAMSWDLTWRRMEDQISSCVARKYRTQSTLPGRKGVGALRLESHGDGLTPRTERGQGVPGAVSGD